MFTEAVKDPDAVQMLVHEDGLELPELAGRYHDRLEHDPSDLHAARRLAQDEERVRIGIFYKNPSLPRYEETRHLPAHTAEDRVAILNEELDRYAI